MVAHLVRLKLTLLRNGLRRSVWQVIGLVLGLAYGLGVTALAVAGIVAVSVAAPELLPTVLVMAGSAVVLKVDTDRVPGYDWLTPSTHPDPLQREAENDERVREFAAILLRRRGIQDPARTPLIEEGVLAALQLYLAQRTAVPLPWLAEVFDSKSETHAHLLAHCTDPQLVRKFHEYAALSPTARRTELAPRDGTLAAPAGTLPVHRLHDDEVERLLVTGERRQELVALFGEQGQVLKRGHELAGVLAPIERRLLKVVSG